MKRVSIIFCTLFLSLFSSMQAQELSDAMDKAIEICTELANSINTTSTSRLKASNQALKDADLANFGDLWLRKGSELDINGHFLFDEDFVDSLIVNRKVIEFSKKYADKREVRGSAGKAGRIKLTTKALKAGQNCVWETLNRKNAEYAIIAEPGGLFTMTIRDEQGKVLYAETRDNKKGANVRKAKLWLPDKRTKLFIEIKNCGKKDASYALLGN